MLFDQVASLFLKRRDFRNSMDTASNHAIVGDKRATKGIGRAVFFTRQKEEAGSKPQLLPTQGDPR